MVWIDPHRS